ncbi:MAG: ABC transporter ATP-binding protein [Fusobacteriaceae bacterium]|jgi:peptide/nickel transport system ATP-binding protein|nr:ABC transporter ATP-binding protein [Fusobacteriaceae bacterium]
MAPLIRTEHLKKYFKVNDGVLHAVDDINLEIYPGRNLGLVGESSCGKSTLGRLVIRLLEPTAGKVFFEGKDILSFTKQERKDLHREMQMIFQDSYSSLNPRMSVFELISEPLVVNHVYAAHQEMAERIYRLMDMVGLARRFANSYPHELDGGRRQRIGVARALAINPKFVVCDEPVSALDASIQAQILNLLMDLQDGLGLTYLFITHDLSVVKHISKEIAVMYMGQCIEKCTTKELFKNPLHPYSKALLASIPIPSLDVKMSRQVIRGEVSNPIDPKPGCRFAPRCDHACDRCKEEQKLTDQGNGHFVACSLYPGA